MRKIALALMLSLALGASMAAAGCTNKKEQQCKDALNNVMTAAKGMAKALGGKGASELEKGLPAEVEKQFVEKCKELPDEVIACIDMKKMLDPKCRELMKQHKDLLPMPKR